MHTFSVPTAVATSGVASLLWTNVVVVVTAAARTEMRSGVREVEKNVVPETVKRRHSSPERSESIERMIAEMKITWLIKTLSFVKINKITKAMRA